MKKRLVILLIIFASLLGFLVWQNKSDINEFFKEFAQQDLPEAVTYDEVRSIGVLPVINNVEMPPQIDTEPLPQVSTEERLEINLAVPFTSQAPHANWDELHNEACEEASMIMVDAFLEGRGLDGSDAVESEIQELVKFETEIMNYPFDITAEETAEMLRRFYGYNQVEVVYGISADDIRRVLAEGLPVIVPAYGRALGNPNFRGAGPRYHMLVVRGFTTDGKFITNDPGTRNGEEYVYDEDVLINAIHDWNDGDVENGRRAMIVVYPNQ